LEDTYPKAYWVMQAAMIHESYGDRAKNLTSLLHRKPEKTREALASLGMEFTPQHIKQLLFWLDIISLHWDDYEELIEKSR